MTVMPYECILTPSPHQVSTERESAAAVEKKETENKGNDGFREVRRAWQRLAGLQPVIFIPTAPYIDLTAM